MLVVSNRFHVVEEHVDEFEERFRNRMGEVESMDGFVKFEFHRPVDHGHIDTDTHAAVTYWEPMDAFEGGRRARRSARRTGILHLTSGSRPRVAWRSTRSGSTPLESSRGRVRSGASKRIFRGRSSIVS